MPRIEPPGGEVSWSAEEGVLGVVGVAPWATIDFLRALYRQVAARKDWHYPRVLVDNNTKLPSRGRHLQLGETDPSPAIAATIRELADQGATLAVVVCNTAHILFDRWAAHSPIPVLNIVDETVGALNSARDRLVAPLASKSLAAADLYGGAVERVGLRVHRLAEASQSVVSALIEAIKIAGELDGGQRIEFDGLVRDLQANGVDTIILGCTELSVLEAPLRQAGFKTIDSNVMLAKAALMCLKMPPSLLSAGTQS